MVATGVGEFFRVLLILFRVSWFGFIGFELSSGKIRTTKFKKSEKLILKSEKLLQVKKTLSSQKNSSPPGRVQGGKVFFTTSVFLHLLVE